MGLSDNVQIVFVGAMPTNMFILAVGYIAGDGRQRAKCQKPQQVGQSTKNNQTPRLGMLKENG